MDTRQRDAMASAAVLETLTPFFEDGVFEAPVIDRAIPLSERMFRLRASGPRRSQRPARPDAIVAPMHVEIVYLIGLSDGRGRPMTLRAISHT